ncbi:MAG: DUF2087 domain-containing protein [Rubrivivax sp.]
MSNTPAASPRPDAAPVNPPAAWPTALVRLSGMVVKTGLMLGQMTDGDRLLALSLPAWRLQEGREHTEVEVNALLKASLAAESAFLRTDHVELRRWLVDTGWWQRDGFGKAYTRPAVNELAEPLQAISRALATVEPAPWALQQVHIHRAAQRERRARWSEAADTPADQPWTPGQAQDPPPEGPR